MKYLPIRTAHLIGFLIKTKDDACICQALKLCSMLNEEQLAYTTIAQDYFDQNIKGKHVSHRIIYPSVIHVHQKAALHILKVLLKKEEIKSQNDNNYF
ncbi:hypothetical protein M9Y10_030881 [Tritrichomonas musculus]|uniref:Uncharacterized protein n=1 Tax=Tritrichomonas musculus TaxID=1915356 RepID=A0ABR2H2A0_9EUKA